LWIEENFNYIQDVIKSYNQNNEIMFIGNDGIISEKINIFNISPDENDTVARKWIKKNQYLNDFFSNYSFPQKEKSLINYQKKLKRKNKIFGRVFSKYCRFKKYFLKEYNHSVQYNI
jgi:predicted secreted protein